MVADKESCRWTTRNLWRRTGRIFWQIVEERVKPARLVSSQKSKSSHGRKAEKWWQHYHQARNRGFYAKIGKLDHVLVNSQVTGTHPVRILHHPKGSSRIQPMCTPLIHYAAFCALQSRPHEIWARLFGSSIKDDLRYTPSDCFETFPFPADWESRADLEAAGKTYYAFRATLMVENNEGLTKTYNRFPRPRGAGHRRIAELRELHEAMDRAVLRAYGWNDLPDVQCEFIPDYEVDEEGSGRKKKPWRYRWPDEVRDEVLMRLLALNRDRARNEKLAGDASGGTRARRSSAR